MNLTWLGHACFELAGENAVILTDPYDASVGYPLHPRRANIVTVSHEHYDHSDTSWIEADAVYRKPGYFKYQGVDIHGIPSFHDTLRGRKRGENIIYKFTMDGLRICHLGDLGHSLDEEKIRTIGRVDILLIPVGGLYTIDAEQALIIAQQLEARLVIAMHYKTDAINMSIDSEKTFLKSSGGTKLDGSSLEVDRHSLPENMEFIALDYLH